MLFFLNISSILATAPSQNCYAHGILQIVDNIKYLSEFNKILLKNYRKMWHYSLDDYIRAYFELSYDEITGISNAMTDFLDRIPEITYINEVANTKIFDKIKKKAEKCAKNIKKTLKRGLEFSNKSQNFLPYHYEEVGSHLKKIEWTLNDFLEKFKIKDQSISYKNQAPGAVLLVLLDGIESLKNHNIDNLIPDSQTAKTLRLVYELQTLISSHISDLQINNLFCTLPDSEYIKMKKNYKILRIKIAKAVYNVLFMGASSELQKIMTNESGILLMHASLLSNINLIFISTDHIWDNFDKNPLIVKDKNLEYNTCKDLYYAFEDLAKIAKELVVLISQISFSQNNPHFEIQTTSNIIMHAEHIANMISIYEKLFENLFSESKEFVLFDVAELFCFRKHICLIIKHLMIMTDEFRHVTRTQRLPDPSTRILSKINFFDHELQRKISQITEILNTVDSYDEIYI